MSECSRGMRLLSLTRNTCSVAARRPHFHKPNARRGPFGILTDEAVQVSELNPVRLGYMARAMRNTTCRDDASACFRSHSNRCGVLVCMPSLQDLSRGRLKIATCLARFADVGCGHGLATSGLAFTHLSLIHISEPTRRTPISYAVFCLKKKKK